MARVALGLTQQDVAARLGTKGASVSRWENDLSYPSGRYLVALGEVFGLPANWWGTPPTEQQVVGNGSPVLDPDARQARRPPRPGIDARTAQLPPAPGRVAKTLVRADSGHPLAGQSAGAPASPEALTPDAIRRAIEETEDLAKKLVPITRPIELAKARTARRRPRRRKNA